MPAFFGGGPRTVGKSLRREENHERDLERERQVLAEERKQLERDRASFEEDFKALEDQRRFLAGQREQLRRDIAAFEAERQSLTQLRSVASQRSRVEGAMEDARKSREAERLRLQSEMAGVIRRR